MVLEFVPICVDQKALTRSLALVWLDVGRDLTEPPWQLSSLHDALKAGPIVSLPILQNHPKMLIRQTASECTSSVEIPVMSKLPQSTAMLPFDFHSFLNMDVASHDPMYALSNVLQHVISAQKQAFSLLKWKLNVEMKGMAEDPRNSNPLDNILFFQSIIERHIDNIQETLQCLPSKEPQP